MIVDVVTKKWSRPLLKQYELEKFPAFFLAYSGIYHMAYFDVEGNMYIQLEGTKILRRKDKTNFHDLVPYRRVEFRIRKNDKELIDKALKCGIGNVLYITIKPHKFDKDNRGKIDFCRRNYSRKGFDVLNVEENFLELINQ